MYECTSAICPNYKVHLQHISGPVPVPSCQGLGMGSGLRTCQSAGLIIAGESTQTSTAPRKVISSSPRTEAMRNCVEWFVRCATAVVAFGGRFLPRHGPGGIGSSRCRGSGSASCCRSACRPYYYRFSVGEEHTLWLAAVELHFRSGRDGGVAAVEERVVLRPDPRRFGLNHHLKELGAGTRSRSARRRSTLGTVGYLELPSFTTRPTAAEFRSISAIHHNPP